MGRRTGKQISNGVKLDGKVVGLAVSRDGHTIAAGTDNRKLYVSDLGGPVSKPVYERPTPVSPSGPATTQVTGLSKWAMSFSPDGGEVAFEDANGTIRPGEDRLR